jgi:phosphate transport system substrate-binding protein
MRRPIEKAVRALGLLLCLVRAFADPVPAHAVERAESDRLIRGAGATFPAPLYQRWITLYRQQRPDVKIVYDEVGSGEGIRRFISGEVDFAGSDAAIGDEQAAQVPRGVQLIPATAGMVVLAYNLKDVNGDLKLKRDVYVDLFAGRITHWDDPRIRETNPDLKLPHQTITIVARQDSSGTTYALTNHLSAVSPEWRDRGPGTGKVIDWPGGTMVARGNEGVASRIKISEGSLGYVEYGFARRLGLSMVWLENKSGRFVKPSERNGQIALSAIPESLPEGLRAFLPDPEGEDAYPIVTFSWLLLYRHYSAPERASALKGFIDWGLTQGQAYASELGYIPLPAGITDRSRAALTEIQ